MNRQTAADPRTIDVKVLYFEGCPNHRPAVERIRQMADELGLEARIDEVEVGPDDDAAALRFLGSPTIQVGGADIDPAARHRTDFAFACRHYGEGGPPTRAMIEAALKEAASADADERGCCELPGAAAGGQVNTEAAASGGSAASRSGLWVSGAAVGTAVIASVCCWLPLLLVALGVSLSLGGLIDTVAFLRPYLLVGAAVLLGLGFYLAYFRGPACAPGSACTTAAPKQRRVSRAMLWGAAVAVLALALFPYYSGALLAADGQQNSQNIGITASSSDIDASDTADAPVTRAFRIEGMTCAGCAAAVQSKLSGLSGVVESRVSLEQETAWLILQPNGPDDDAIAEAVRGIGFSAAPDPDPHPANPTTP